VCRDWGAGFMVEGLVGPQASGFRDQGLGPTVRREIQHRPVSGLSRVTSQNLFRRESIYTNLALTVFYVAHWDLEDRVSGLLVGEDVPEPVTREHPSSLRYDSQA